MFEFLDLNFIESLPPTLAEVFASVRSKKVEQIDGAVYLTIDAASVEQYECLVENREKILGCLELSLIPQQPAQLEVIYCDRLLEGCSQCTQDCRFYPEGAWGEESDEDCGDCDCDCQELNQDTSFSSPEIMLSLRNI